MAAKKKPKGDCKKASDEAAAKEPAVAAPATEEAPARPSRPSAAAAVPKRSSPTKRTRSHSPMRMGKASTIHPRACAIIYDDNMMNFAGIVPRGKVPNIRAVHCLQPLTVAQLEEALALHQEEQEALAMQQDSAEDPVPPPNLFFFFDFDDTLSLCSGIDLSVNANDCDATLARLFGDDARQAALVKLLSALLLQERIFVLTANRGYQMGAHLLNLLLGMRGTSHVGGRHLYRSWRLILCSRLAQRSAETVAIAVVEAWRRSISKSSRWHHRSLCMPTHRTKSHGMVAVSHPESLTRVKCASRLF